MEFVLGVLLGMAVAIIVMGVAFYIYLSTDKSSTFAIGDPVFIKGTYDDYDKWARGRIVGHKYKKLLVEYEYYNDSTRLQDFKIVERKLKQVAPRLEDR